MRQLLGYERLEHPELVELINGLCRSEWRQCQNFFRSTFKLKGKTRVGGKVRKEYENPKTPYERAMRSPGVSAEAKEKLKEEFEAANPFDLKRSLEKKFKKIFTMNWQLAKERRLSVKQWDESKVQATAACAQPPLRFGFAPAAVA